MTHNFLKATVKDGMFGFTWDEIESNKWVSDPPYGTLQNVLVQDYENNVYLSWVGSRIEKDEFGDYHLSIEGGDWAAPLKYYMIIPFPFEDSANWNIIRDGSDMPEGENKQYLVCIEEKQDYHINYFLGFSHFVPETAREWSLLDQNDFSKDVIAWRAIPRPKRI